MRLIQMFILCGSAAGLFVPRNHASAQLVRGEVAASGGVATDQRGVRSSAVTLSPSVLLAPDPRFSAALAASATQFGSSAHALGGTAMLGARLPLGSVVALAASAAGSATQTSFNATYSSAELTPTLEATIAGVTLFGGAHIASGASSIRQATSAPGGVFAAPTAGVRDVTSSRTSAGAVFGGVLNVADAGGTISYREEHARVAGVQVVDRVATGTVASGSLAFTASGGLRDAPDEQIGYGSVSAGFALGRAMTLQGAVGSYPSNRVTGTFGGRFASIGISVHGLRRLDNPVNSASAVRGAPAVPSGATRLAIRAPGSQKVEVAGDWNSWTPALATRTADGTWYADVRLPQGEHRYAFRLDGQRWSVPDGVASVDDGVGGRSALVTVR